MVRTLQYEQIPVSGGRDVTGQEPVDVNRRSRIRLATLGTAPTCRCRVTTTATANRPGGLPAFDGDVVDLAVEHQLHDLRRLTTVGLAADSPLYHRP